MPPRPAGRSGSWLPAIQIQSRPACSAGERGAVARRQARRAVVVVEAVAEGDDDLRLEPRDQARRGAPASRRCRRAAAIWPRRAKDEPFSRCRSATTSRRSSAHHSAPSGKASRTTPRTPISAGVAWRRRRAGQPLPRAPQPSPIASLTRSSAASRSTCSSASPLATDFLADLQHDRNGQRRDAVEPLVHDSALDSRQHIAEPADVEEAGRGVGPGGLQQDVVGLVLAEHVVDEVGRDRHLPAGLLLAGMALLDQPGDQRAVPEHALQEVALRHPGFEVVAEHVLVEQLGEASARPVSKARPRSPRPQTASE